MCKKNIFSTFTLIIGFIIIACNDGTNNYGQNVINYENKPIGTLTITNLDEYNNNYIGAYTYYVNADNKGIYTSYNGLWIDAYDGETGRGLINNGSVTLKIWLRKGDYLFNGNGKIVFEISIVDQAKGLASIIKERRIEITFNNWIGTGVWVD
ncbi:MAG: hypothetical protein FWC06_04885 [Treponema sp.]|nr:hypothetical protein [Treponema sp.]